MSKTKLLKVHRFTDTTIIRIDTHEFKDEGVKYSTMRIITQFKSPKKNISKKEINIIEKIIK